MNFWSKLFGQEPRRPPPQPEDGTPPSAPAAIATSETKGLVVARTQTTSPMDEKKDSDLNEWLRLLEPDVSWETNIRAANALGELGDRNAIEPLIKTLGVEHSKRDVREAAAEALAKLGEPKWRELIQCNENDYRRLANCGDSRVLAALINGLKQRSRYGDPEKALASYWEKTREALALEALFTALDEGSVRAAEALAEIKAAESLPHLLRVLGKQSVEAVDSSISRHEALAKKDWRVECRIAAAKALAQVGDKRAVEPLLEILNIEGRTSEVGKQVAFALQSLGHHLDQAKISPCSDDAHDWPLNAMTDTKAWSNATLTVHDWPACRKCGISLADFIDLNDLPADKRVPDTEFRALMQARHQHILRALHRQSEEVYGTRPYGNRSPIMPIQYYIQLDDPGRAIDIPGGGRPIEWPLYRMVGWKLWLSGGTSAMRALIARAQGVSLDMLWNRIGFGNDQWQA